MTEERIQEMIAYATHRLITTGDILAAYALQVIDFANEAVEARNQAGHSAAELMKLLSQVEKERDEAIRLGDERLATLWDEKKAETAKIAAERDEARAEVERLKAENDFAKIELDAAIRNIARLLAAVEQWEKKARDLGWTEP